MLRLPWRRSAAHAALPTSAPGPSHLALPDDPFVFPGPVGSGACLLIHGSTGTAGDMRFLGEFLHDEGYAVVGVALPGHRRRPSELDGVDWRACYRAVSQSWRELRSRHPRVHVIGFSFGAALAIHLAAREEVTSLVLLAPALFVHMRPRALMNLTVSSGQGIPFATYVRWYAGLARFFRLVRQDLSHIRCPLVAIHARDDDTVRVESSLEIYKRVHTGDRQLLVLERGGHLLPNGIAREQISREIERFLRRLNGRPGGGS